VLAEPVSAILVAALGKTRATNAATSDEITRNPIAAAAMRSTADGDDENDGD
jgi:hypothetical protein